MVIPRVIDNSQVYLRELRIDNLKGSAEAHRDFFNYFLFGILPTINHVSAKNRSNSAEN